MKKFWIAAGVVLLVGLSVSLIYLELISDKTGPKIIFKKTDFVYHEGDSYDALLSGVSARDDVDGDVSDSLIVVSVLPLTEGSTAKVLYAAKDKSNNLTTTNLMVDYVASAKSTEDKKKDSADTIESKDSKESMDSTETSDLDTSDNTKESLDDAADRTESVDNTDTSDTTEPEQYPYIKLSSKEMTVKKGTNFDVLSVVEAVKDDKDNIDQLSRRIQVYGNYYTSKVGTYQLKYLVTDTEQNYSNIEVFTLHVIQ